MGKLTIREIARMAGVSTTAVSFVINGKKGVSDQTRDKVNAIIHETGFKPSVNSRRLFYKKSYNISIIIKQTSSPFDDLFYFEIAKGLLEQSKAYGYNIVFSDIHEKGKTIVLPGIVVQNDTDGVIFFQDTEKSILNEIKRYGIPCVVVDSHSVIPDTTVVTPDYMLSAYTAVRHLTENGHRNIAFIGSSYIPEFYEQVMTGYNKALMEVNAAAPACWIKNYASDEVSSYKCMKEILDSGHIPSAVFCAGDIFAIGAMKCSRDMGYKVPYDISFIGIDDILLSRYYEPKLTTIHIDMAKMGEIAMELIIKKINGEPAESVIVVSDNLIVRDSVIKK